MHATLFFSHTGARASIETRPPVSGFCLVASPERKSFSRTSRPFARRRAGSSTPKSGKKEKKEKKDKKEKRERREDANTDADEAKKQKVRDETESGGGTPTRVRVVGLTKSANAGSLSEFLGLDAAEVVVGMWGTHGKGPKPPGGQAFASVKSRRAAESLVAAYDGKTRRGRAQGDRR